MHLFVVIVVVLKAPMQTLHCCLDINEERSNYVFFDGGTLLSMPFVHDTPTSNERKSAKEHIKKKEQERNNESNKNATYHPV